MFTKEQRRVDDFDYSFIARTIKVAARKIKYISLTGGEVFYNIDSLFLLAENLYQAGCSFSVVTNGLWTRRVPDVGNVILKLKERGLDGISVSFDEYHRPRLEEEELIAFLMLAVAKGIRVEVKSCGSKMKPFTRRVRQKFRRQGIPIQTELFSLDKTGTARNLRDDAITKRLPTSCTMIGVPVVMPDGTVNACCSAKAMEFRNPWLIRGNSRRTGLNQILTRSESDLRLIATAALGPGGFARILGMKPRENQTGCDFCVSVLNDPSSRKEVEELILRDKKLRKEIVGRFLLLSYKVSKEEKEKGEAWDTCFSKMKTR